MKCTTRMFAATASWRASNPSALTSCGRKYPVEDWKMANHPLSSRMSPVIESGKRPSARNASSSPRSSRMRLNIPKALLTRRSRTRAVIFQKCCFAFPWQDQATAAAPRTFGRQSRKLIVWCVYNVFRNCNQVLPVARGKPQPEFVAFDWTRSQVEALGHIVVSQARRVQPFFERIRLAVMAEAIAVPYASQGRHLVEAGPAASLQRQGRVCSYRNI